MGMTIAEKILAKKSGLKQVKPGEYVTAKIDILMSGEYLGEFYKAFNEIGIEKVWDPERIIALTDHSVPSRNIQDAESDVLKRKFVKQYGLKYWYDVGRGGICHQVMPEKGHVLPGMLVLGADSHSTSYGAFNAAGTGTQIPEAYWVAAKGELWFLVPETFRFEMEGELPNRVMGKDVMLKIAGDYGTDFATYKSLEFVGSAVKKMTLSDRWAIANMGVEVGAKFALFEADEKTLSFLKGRAREPFAPVTSDEGAVFERVYRMDVSGLEPQVACPHDVGNVKPVREVSGMPVDQGFIGSCTGGRMEDLAAAVEVLKGRKVHPRVRLIVSPASMEVYQEALRAGIVEALVGAEAIVCGPSCGPCAGVHMGILASGERCISASNRNFKGRMGSPESEIFLASPATVAASALAGEIVDPRDV